MNNGFRIFCFIALLLSGLAREVQPAFAQKEGQTPDISAIIEQYQQEIPLRMQAENVPGLAIAVVDDQGILWAQGFGFTDIDGKKPISADTPFAIQSMSKSFAATAAMFAAQEGLVDLDTPITEYLPDFHFRSLFEERPEQKITLRMLLSHTAGLAHEAPVGGNFDLPDHNFEEHIASINNTWLRFPVGQRYAYSNLGVDLAAYILQVRSGKSYEQYMKEKVFVPLGMVNSTLDNQVIRDLPDRAIGHAINPIRPPVKMLILGAGGVYTTANDMARYLRFHINEGQLDGKQLLAAGLAETMYTPPNQAALDAGYALGIAVSEKIGARRFQHGGGGFGFNSNMVWYPEFKLGAVVLTNAEHASLYVQLTDEILDKILLLSPDVYRVRALAEPSVQAAIPADYSQSALSDAAFHQMILSHALPVDEAARLRRRAYAGNYILTQWGIPIMNIPVMEQDGNLSFRIAGSDNILTEVQPGLFFDSQGEVFDLTGPQPTSGNMRLFKEDRRMLPLLIVFYGLCGLAFLTTLLIAPAWRLVRRLRRGDETVAMRSRLLTWAGLLAALAGLFGLLCLGFVAAVPNMIHVPWPLPYRDLHWFEIAFMSLPFAGLILAVVVSLLAFLAWKKGAVRRPGQIYYALIALALLSFNMILLLP